MKLNWFDRENQERLALARYRSPENIHKEEVLQEFLDFLGEEYGETFSENTRHKLTLAACVFLGYGIKKVGQGEQTLLARWIQSVKGK